MVILPRYDFHYDSLHKHLYNVFFLGSQPTGIRLNLVFQPTGLTSSEIFSPGVDFPGATHCEEIPYMFDVSKYYLQNISSKPKHEKVETKLRLRFLSQVEIPLIFCNLTEVQLQFLSQLL